MVKLTISIECGDKSNKLRVETKAKGSNGTVAELGFARFQEKMAWRAVKVVKSEQFYFNKILVREQFAIE